MEGVHNNTFSSIRIFIIQKLEHLITAILDHFGQLNAGTSLFAIIAASYCIFLPTTIQSKMSRINFATHDKDVYYKDLFTIVCMIILPF